MSVPFQYLRGAVSAMVIAAALASSALAFAAQDLFLKIDGVDGESTDARHKGEIDVLAWSWGVSKLGAPTVNGRTPVSCISDLEVTKYVDMATPALLTAGVKDSVFPTVQLTVRKAGETPMEYFTVIMKDVTISSYATGGSGGEDRLVENVTLHFNSATGSYIPQDTKGNSGIPITWDVVEEKRKRGQTCP